MRPLYTKQKMDASAFFAIFRIDVANFSLYGDFVAAGNMPHIWRWQ
jgi:hypothetical protein